ncbi:hypothetical protein I8J29_07705 [Paenibacillus sp. MWE-103]|uniref:Energy-coupling factor transport system substrate-specific component n=1 Tax=Paenibacillus artemisiicola TaxID=1172618 RepID=A0ABS3W717_9BACL|nr:hypothetical protein [Paenibacillus artemisiicola]MBO7744073.1 hypothetical protein [Paenibacillus artemisiicola]
MNDGFIAIWLLSMAAILYFTGWERQVADGLPLRTLGAFIGATCVLHAMSVTVRGQAEITGSAALAIGSALVLLVIMRKPGAIFFTLFSALLTGFMWMWMGYIYSMDPVFVVVHPAWDGPLLAGLFAGLLADRFRTHFVIAALSAVVALGQAYLGPAAHDGVLFIGSLSWWDGLIIALTAARLTSAVKAFVKEKALGVLDSRSGEQGGSS